MFRVAIFLVISCFFLIRIWTMGVFSFGMMEQLVIFDLLWVVWMLLRW